ncbi:MAG: hypothetical protein E3J23_04865 [Candidatus Stahlbacteria bacterium]|jgi:hypothetical protein|nr:MAG: hypothetical protein E3J23_04865 [Candidatus Stahlbacteria bacterium]
MTIESYSFGSIKIDGIIYKKDVIIFPERVFSPWWRESGHSLSINDLKEVIEYKPDLIIIGTGALGAVSIPNSTLEFLRINEIRVKILQTKDAVSIFNQEMEKRQNVVACLHLTC